MQTSKLAELRRKTPEFSVQLAQNDFKCDCLLYSFYKMLKNDPGIVSDSNELLCDHTYSWSMNANKRVVDTKLDLYCAGGSLATQSVKPVALSNTTLTISTRKTSKNSSNSRSSKRSLSMFVIGTFLFGCCILLLVKPKCFMQKNIRQPTAYVDDFTRLTMSTELCQENINRPKTFKQWLNYVYNSVKFKRFEINANIFRRMFRKKSSSARSATHSNIEMRRLSEESLNCVDTNSNVSYGNTTTTANTNTNNATSMKTNGKPVVLKIKQMSSSDEESEHEEETIMDSIVRQDSSHFKYKQMKAKTKSDSYYPEVFIP